MKHARPTRKDTEAAHGTLRSYSIGFGLSILLTLGAFLIAPSLGELAIPVIILAALFQLLVQLTFFLHLGKSATPRSHIFIFVFTLVIIGIVVGGTLWIMTNLEHLHMQPVTTDDLYLHGTVAPQNELR